MKKKYFFILFLCLFSSANLAAGPFGLEKGMSLEEINEACGRTIPRRIANDDRYYISPLKSHSVFSEYIAWIDDEEGLYYIRAISDPIYTSKFGTELQNEFHSFRKRLEKIYGKSELEDEMITDDSIYDSDDSWLYALEKGYRRLEALWLANPKYGPFKDDIIEIYLWTNAEAYSNNGYLLLDYKFLNALEVEANEDEVL